MTSSFVRINDSPDSGDYHSPSSTKPNFSPAKRDSTPPPNQQILLEFYGHPTWAPFRFIRKRNIGKILPIPFILDDDDDDEKKKNDETMANGDLPHLCSSNEKNIDDVSPHGDTTPSPNTKFLCKQYGDLTFAPSSDRIRRRIAIRLSHLPPRRLSFNDEE